MSGNHRVDQSSKARMVIAGAMTAGALLIVPVGAAVMAPGVANAVTPIGSPTTGAGAGKATVIDKTIRLPFVKIEIRNVVGDHKPPTIKVVPFPGLHRRATQIG